jgi:cyclic pyranopterin phosphate synthase
MSNSPIVDIGDKPIIDRKATATGLLILSKMTQQMIKDCKIGKGDVREASTIAAILAVKETPRLIPHCHPIPISGCDVEWDLSAAGLRCTVSVMATWKTGVEMEALAGVSAALLCAWDMVKPYEKDSEGQYPETRIADIRVLEKKKSKSQ